MERACNIEYLMLVLDFKVNYRQKIPQGISVEYKKYLNKDT